MLGNINFVKMFLNTNIKVIAHTKRS